MSAKLFQLYLDISREHLLDYGLSAVVLFSILVILPCTILNAKPLYPIKRQIIIWIGWVLTKISKVIGGEIGQTISVYRASRGWNLYSCEKYEGIWHKNEGIILLESETSSLCLTVETICRCNKCKEERRELNAKLLEQRRKSEAARNNSRTRSPAVTPNRGFSGMN